MFLKLRPKENYNGKWKHKVGKNYIFLGSKSIKCSAGDPPGSKYESEPSPGNFKNTDSGSGPGIQGPGSE